MSKTVNSHKLYATISVVGLGAAIGVLLYRKRLFGPKRAGIKLPQVFVVSNLDQWSTVAEKLQAACTSQKVIGLDCEWKAQTTPKEQSHHPVALLQLSTPDDLCVLVRLNKIGPSIPDSLKLLLEDKSILKVGVAVIDDSKKLMNDYGLLVEGCLDLRHLVDRVPKYAQLERKGLKNLAESLLNVRMRKSTSIRLSNWEAEELTSDQVNYAAEDSVVSALIFHHLVSHMLMSWPERLVHKKLKPGDMHARVVELVGHLVDHRYRASISPAKMQQNKLMSVPSGFPGTQQTRAYSVRQTPLYHNCQLQAPDGEILSTCDTKKAMWYVERDLAVVINENPLVVRLKFEPSARPILDNKYYAEEKKNQCVVCGNKESLVRKTVIPHEYRRFFPKVMKNHLSHDVLLLCVQCHLMSNKRDCILRQQLAFECGAPLGSESKLKEDRQLKKVKSVGRALLHSVDKMPETRKEDLLKVLKDFYQVSDITEPLIHVAAEIETNVDNENFVLHGKKVVDYVSSHDGLLAFEIRWRQHFLDSMRPRFLPKLWSVDHNHQRLALQLAENKENDFDIRILGPLPRTTDFNMNKFP